MEHQLMEPGVIKRSATLTSTVTTDPTSLFFETVQLQPSDLKKIEAVISGVSANARTTITMPDFYETFSTGDVPVKTLTVTGNLSITFFVRFTGSQDPGIFNGLIFIQGLEIPTKTISVSTAVSSNPSFFPSHTTVHTGRMCSGSLSCGDTFM